MTPSVVIIPTYISKENHAELLKTCLLSLRRTAEDVKILVIDDASPNVDVVNFLSKLKEKFDIDFVQKEENEGFSTTVNIGLKWALENKHNAILCNSDIEFKEIGWLEEFEKSEGDIVGSLLVYPNGIIQHAGVYFSPITRSFDHRYKGAPGDLPVALVQEDCPVTAALQLIRLNVLEELGLYDEQFKLGFEDVDYSIRALEAGFRIVYNPKIKAIHYEHMFRRDSSEKHDKWQMDSLMTLFKKHKNKDFYGLVPSMH